MNQLNTNNEIINEKEKSKNNEININLLSLMQKEIKKEKKFYLITTLISLIITFFILTITIFSTLITFEKIKLNWLPKNLFFIKLWWIQIIVSFIFIWLLTMSSLSYIKIKQEEKIYYSNINSFNLERLPIFIKSSYKKNIAFKIFINWFSIISYILTCFFICFLIFLKEKGNWSFSFSGIKLSFEIIEKIQIKYIIYSSIYLFIIFLLHLFLYILLTKKNNKINILFDIENKINKNEIRIFKRNVNFICAFIFLLPLLIFIFFIWIIKRKKRYI